MGMGGGGVAPGKQSCIRRTQACIQVMNPATQDRDVCSYKVIYNRPACCTISECGAAPGVPDQRQAADTGGKPKLLSPWSRQ